MISKSRLYDAYGEIIYAVAIADGIIQPEELQVIEEKLKQFPWGEDVKWSFNYEKDHHSSLKETYLKALNTLSENGPHAEYANLVEILEEVAKASDGFDRKEGRVISIFNKSLQSHFLEFLDENGLMKR